MATREPQTLSWRAPAVLTRLVFVSVAAAASLANVAVAATLGAKGGLPPTMGTPIMVVGMPKAGTSTIAAYFQCGNVKSSHYQCVGNEYCGVCIDRNVKAGVPPFANCGDYDVYSQLDIMGNCTTKKPLVKRGMPEGTKSGARRGLEPWDVCYMPQVEALEAIHSQFPNATFILNHRQHVDDWIKSVNHWGDLRERFGDCQISGLPAGKGAPGAAGDEQLKAFVAKHVLDVRRFVRQHPSHQLIEVVIDNPSAGRFMESKFNIRGTCWGHENNNKNSIGRRAWHHRPRSLLPRTA
uniref:Sulfotransferase n=1 Tax=Mantoniella antarctica TaxID=81844 RepID=A0A7S0X5R9_9CHLO|mmetsp:Transcript_19613/g.48517  ORF Transcript_19613/g.48517 Transcript_19613/m.48517 type:complete len:295 (+) Transcript_19613:290-1174(+)|eukprot:CAMPEP_0181370416 /NCGR_PEP_ID=MMETSP1106-20121128/13410_1 /TAXON_ID=81844 /ORGANISM="Mantoniella antarctica, Strain SL-175" /LENGTH=294 /DNA_ID=CAMNT_0023487199 /DNA_START=133 /DNA_END=1017 /DNA_ORIENTATION=-